MRSSASYKPPLDDSDEDDLPLAQRFPRKFVSKQSSSPEPIPLSAEALAAHANMHVPSTSNSNKTSQPRQEFVNSAGIMLSNNKVTVETSRLLRVTKWTGAGGFDWANHQKPPWKLRSGDFYKGTPDTRTAALCVGVTFPSANTYSGREASDKSSTGQPTTPNGITGSRRTDSVALANIVRVVAQVFPDEDLRTGHKVYMLLDPQEKGGLRAINVAHDKVFFAPEFRDATETSSQNRCKTTQDLIKQRLMDIRLGTHSFERPKETVREPYVREALAMPPPALLPPGPRTPPRSVPSTYLAMTPASRISTSSVLQTSVNAIGALLDLRCQGGKDVSDTTDLIYNIERAWPDIVVGEGQAELLLQCAAFFPEKHVEKNALRFFVLNFLSRADALDHMPLSDSGQDVVARANFFRRFESRFRMIPSP